MCCRSLTVRVQCKHNTVSGDRRSIDVMVAAAADRSWAHQGNARSGHDG
jgi:hypothetical protein